MRSTARRAGGRTPIARRGFLRPTRPRCHGRERSLVPFLQELLGEVDELARLLWVVLEPLFQAVARVEPVVAQAVVRQLVDDGQEARRRHGATPPALARMESQYGSPVVPAGGSCFAGAGAGGAEAGASTLRGSAGAGAAGSWPGLALRLVTSTPKLT